MIVRAPGKIVLSGAYAVLEGAPALVAAVDRYVDADARRPADFVTPEVRAALAGRPAPWFDASPLRDENDKIGLGSSAAIVVASLGAVAVLESGPMPDRLLSARVFAPALEAHRKAQGGGSGIDVAASAFGGVIIAERRGDSLDVQPAKLPEAVVFRVIASGAPASTAELVATVRKLRDRSPGTYDAALAELCRAALDARRATEQGDGPALLDALGRQLRGLDALGRKSGAPIVTDAVLHLAAKAARSGGIVLPAGAGGGDIALYAAPAEPTRELESAVEGAGHRFVDLSFGARGVHVA